MEATNRTTDFIFGGTSVPSVHFPWFATLFAHPPGGGNPSLCGGVFVAPRVIATAAHCVYGFEAVTVYPASQKVTWYGDRGGTVSDTLIASPSYSASSGAEHDVGVIVLPEGYTAPAVARVDLDGKLWAELPEGAPISAIGHGLSCDSGTSCITKNLHLATIPKVDRASCVGDSPTTWAASTVGAALCAGYTDRDEAPQPCRGDSGGPLFDGDTVYGLVSRGDASLGCGHSRRPTLFCPLTSDFIATFIPRSPPPPELPHVPDAPPSPGEPSLSTVRSLGLGPVPGSVPVPGSGSGYPRIRKRALWLISVLAFAAAAP